MKRVLYSEEECDESRSLRQMQRTYARGRFDGLRLAGIAQPEEFMRMRKLMDAEHSLNGIARKILEAVPTKDGATLNKINADLIAQGHNLGFPVVEGSVRQAHGLGLVKDLGGGLWQRVEIEPVKADNVAPFPTQPATFERLADELQRAREVDPLERLALISASVKTLATCAQQISQLLDDAALEFAEQLQRSEIDGAKLKQLRELLSSIK